MRAGSPAAAKMTITAAVTIVPVLRITKWLLRRLAQAQSAPGAPLHVSV